MVKIGWYPKSWKNNNWQWLWWALHLSWTQRRPWEKSKRAQSTPNRFYSKVLSVFTSRDENGEVIFRPPHKAGNGLPRKWKFRENWKGHFVALFWHEFKICRNLRVLLSLSRNLPWFACIASLALHFLALHFLELHYFLPSFFAIFLGI